TATGTAITTSTAGGASGMIPGGPATASTATGNTSAVVNSGRVDMVGPVATTTTMIASTTTRCVAASQIGGPATRMITILTTPATTIRRSETGSARERAEARRKTTTPIAMTTTRPPVETGPGKARVVGRTRTAIKTGTIRNRAVTGSVRRMVRMTTTIPI